MPPSRPTRPWAASWPGNTPAQEELDKAETLYLAVLKKDPTVAAYKELMELCRKNNRDDTLLAVLGDVVEKEGLLDALGAEEKAIAADAALRGRLVAAARQRLRHGPDKLGFGMRKAVAMLALEGKDHAVAAEFFDLAIASRPKEAADLLLLWGVGLFMDDRPAEAVQGAPPRTGPEATGGRAGLPLLPGRRPGAVRPQRRGPGRRPQGRRYAAATRRGFPAACPGSFTVPSAYDEAIAAYLALLARFDGPPAVKLQELLRSARSALAGRDWHVLAADALAAATIDDDRWPGSPRHPPRGRGRSFPPSTS